MGDQKTPQNIEDKDLEDVQGAGTTKGLLGDDFGYVRDRVVQDDAKEVTKWVDKASPI